MKRCDFGDLIDDLFERGLEISLAGSLIVNGITALDVRSNGEPLAPFLRSSLDVLSTSPPLAACGLILMGALYLIVLMIDMRRPLVSARCLVAIASATIYLLIVVAIATGHEPKTAALRYVWSSVLALLCFLGTFRLTLAQRARKAAN